MSIEAFLATQRYSLKGKDEQIKVELFKQFNELKNQKMQLSRDLTSYAILCLYKPNVEKFIISPQSQAKIL